MRTSGPTCCTPLLTRRATDYAGRTKAGQRARLVSLRRAF